MQRGCPNAWRGTTEVLKEGLKQTTPKSRNLDIELHLCHGLINTGGLDPSIKKITEQKDLKTRKKGHCKCLVKNKNKLGKGRGGGRWQGGTWLSGMVPRRLGRGVEGINGHGTGNDKDTKTEGEKARKGGRRVKKKRRKDLGSDKKRSGVRQLRKI